MSKKLCHACVDPRDTGLPFYALWDDGEYVECYFCEGTGRKLTLKEMEKREQEMENES
jgi:hypothetical protein